MRAAAAEDRKLVDRVAEAIECLGGIPQVVPYEASVSELNYLEIDYLAGVLVEELNRQLRFCLDGVLLCATQPTAQGIFSYAVQLTRGQLAALSQAAA